MAASVNRLPGAELVQVDAGKMSAIYTIQKGLWLPGFR